MGMGMGMGMGMAERVWSPGGGGAMMTPRVEITQSAAMGTPGLGGPGQGQGGAATPGAGIVVTKWDHLNLKPELLRGIVKYGYVFSLALAICREVGERSRGQEHRADR
jgi:hypothetical protein